MAEQTITIVKGYSVGNPDSVVVVIPKEVQVRLGYDAKGQKFLVKIDGKGRIIFEPIKEEVTAK